MKRTSQEPGDRLPLLITLGVFVVMLACVPLALGLDDRIDGDRPMYHDMERLEGLEAAYIATGQPPVEARLRGGQSVVVGETEFVASDGVTIAVVAGEDGTFCISASNEDGASAERCSE